MVPEVNEAAEAGEGGALLQQPGHAAQAHVGAGVEPEALQTDQGVLSQQGQPARVTQPLQVTVKSDHPEDGHDVIMWRLLGGVCSYWI